MDTGVHCGVQASASRGRQATDATPPDLVRDSLDPDLALAAESPTVARWGHLVGIADPEGNPIAIQIHPATGSGARRLVAAGVRLAGRMLALPRVWED
jgi:hypothetical protein